MRKVAFIFLGLGVIGSANAALNFNLDLPYQSVTLPTSGFVLVTFTGTVDITLPTVDAVAFGGDLPGLTPGGPFLSGTIDPGFSAYLAGASPGLDYTGALFSITVASTDLPGNYFYNAATTSNFAEVFVTGSDGVDSFMDTETFGVTVNPVPEPASMAVLGLGVAALLRRRKRA